MCFKSPSVNGKVYVKFKKSYVYTITLFDMDGKALDVLITLLWKGPLCTYTSIFFWKGHLCTINFISNGWNNTLCTNNSI